MGHIPLIHGSDGAKLSKRHGALGVESYRAMGYVPDALRNYLVRLGWSHGDQEIFSTKEMIELFDISKVGRAAARFDFVKLENVNGQYLRAMPDEEIVRQIEALVPDLPGGGRTAALLKSRRAQLIAAMPGLKERAKTLIELIDGASFLFAERPLPLDEKAAALLNAEGRDTLKKALGALEKVEPWSAEGTEAAVRELAESLGMKLGAVAQPLRAALTGKSTSPGIFDVLSVLGKDESLARLRDQAPKAA
jgi:glutamyl-tRNA synthetase